MSIKIKVLVVFVFAIIVAVLILFSGLGSESRQTQAAYISADWAKKYGLNDLEPKGLFLFSKFLKERLTDQRAIYPLTNPKTMDSLVEMDATLFFVGENFALKDRELEDVIEMVEQGNTLFLSCDQMTRNVIEELFQSYKMTYEYESKTTVHVLDEIAPFSSNKEKSYSFNAVFQNDAIAREWAVFDEITIFGEELKLLSSIKEDGDYPNFIVFNRGKGKIYLQTMPETLLNYQLLKKDGSRQAKFVLQAFPKDRNAYWLDFAQLTKANEDMANEDMANEDKERDESYLQFLFSNSNLRLGMLLTFCGFILFLFFRIKRQRPVIQLKAKKRNTSVEFSRTVATIFMSRQNPHGLLQLQKKNFYDLIQRSFFLDLKQSNNYRERTVESLSQKSNVPVDEILKLLLLLETKVKINVDEAYLFEINKRIKLFIAASGIQLRKIPRQINKVGGEVRRELLISSSVLISGLVLFLFGFWLLAKGIGIGALCLPIGTVNIFVAIRSLSLPVLNYSMQGLIHYPLFGRKKEYLWQDLLNLENDENGMECFFKGGQKLKIKWNEISRFDQIHLERFINNDLKNNN